TLSATGRTLTMGAGSFEAGFGAGTVNLAGGTFSQLSGNTFLVDCRMNVSGAFIQSAGSLLVGSIHASTLNLSASTLSMGVNGISADSTIGSSFGAGTVTFNSASNGTFDTNLHLGVPQPGQLNVLGGSVLFTRSMEIGPNSAGFFANSQVL